MARRPRPQQSAPGHPSPTGTPKPSGDHVSASSTSSYAASISSSTFTLSSTTDESSTSLSLFDGRPNQDRAENGIFALQLKRLYREITNLETKIKQEDSMDDSDDVMSSRVVLKGKEVENDDLEKEKWKKQMSDHKTLVFFLTSRDYFFLNWIQLVWPKASITCSKFPYHLLSRHLCESFLPNITSLFGYGPMLSTSYLNPSAVPLHPLALEHLQDFIYYAYIFYTGLLEEPTLVSFKSGWLEALGDIAWYRMAVAAMVNDDGSGQGGLTINAMSEAAAESSDANESSREKQKISGSTKSISDAPAARIDDSPSLSIGLAAARLLEVEPEKERWRNIARDWYAAGIAEQPGMGKLHHHLGLLSREVEGEELRGVYHFVKRYSRISLILDHC